ncbi:MAG: SpoIIE family protein phosphatase [Deltaproteobacteria bacterium]|jgi:sigma-B regulation protein RsbU (phosphoserine phosphatase)|nr:SpoIIE family protein phosphatase [Deltaproteobacteria bacterium]
MGKLKLIYIKNVMLVANGLANLFGAVFVTALLSRVLAPVLPTSIVLAGQKFHSVFTFSAFGFAIIFTLLYERPVRQYLDALSKDSTMPAEFVTQARRRLLNEPFALLALDLVIWISAAIVYPVYYWTLGTGPVWIKGSIVNALTNGLVTITFAFFLLEHILQKSMAPYVFPEGGLYKIPKTVRIRIRMRLAALIMACSLIPLLSILHIMHQTPLLQSDAAAALQQMRSAMPAIIFVFLILAFFLTVLVSRNLTSPFNEIVQTLRRVKNGRFDKKVQVTSNDEIGYTGDVINEMTEGLMERERMQQSLNLAKEIQQNLLPKGNLKVNGFDIAGKSVYCDETGGDYYDFISIEDADKQKIGVAIGDVSGHGISSALLMSAVRSSLRLRASLSGSIARIISDVNRQLVQDVEDSGQFMTLFFLALNTESRQLEWVRAGHDPAIIYDPGLDSFNELSGSGIALGVDGEWIYEDYKKTDFSKGQIIFLSTDGVWEARNKKGEMLGKAPILNAIRKNHSLEASQIIDAVFGILDQFIGEAKIEDDITSVVIKMQN